MVFFIVVISDSEMEREERIYVTITDSNVINIFRGYNHGIWYTKWLQEFFKRSFAFDKYTFKEMNEKYDYASYEIRLTYKHNSDPKEEQKLREFIEETRTKINVNMHVYRCKQLLSPKFVSTFYLFNPHKQ